MREALDLPGIYQEEELPLDEVGVIEDQCVFLDEGLPAPDEEEEG